MKEIINGIDSIQTTSEELSHTLYGITLFLADLRADKGFISKLQDNENDEISQQALELDSKLKAIEQSISQVKTEEDCIVDSLILIKDKLKAVKE